jgi:L-iditol 2-dehydrogenase
MRAVIFQGAGRLAPADVPRPAAGAGELLLRLRGCGLCGSDIAKLADPAARVPAVLGHEVVGDVVEAGEGVAGFAVGDRVVAAHHVPCGECHYCRRGSESMCRAFKESNLDPGGFAEFVRVPAANVRSATFRVPEHLTDEEASFVEPLACCLRAVERARVQPGDTAVVVGRVLDEADARVRALSAGRGADHVIVTAGATPALEWAVRIVRDGGSIHAFAGGPGDALPVALEALYHRELTVTTTYSSSPGTLARAFWLIAAGKVDVEGLVSHRLPLERLAEGVDLMRRRQALKVYVTP